MTTYGTHLQQQRISPGPPRAATGPGGRSGVDHPQSVDPLPPHKTSRSRVDPHLTKVSRPPPPRSRKLI